MVPLSDGIVLCDKLCYRVNEFLIDTISIHSLTFRPISSPSMRPSLVYSIEPSQAPSMNIRSKTPKSDDLTFHPSSLPSSVPSLTLADVYSPLLVAEYLCSQSNFSPTQIPTIRTSSKPSIDEPTWNPKLQGSTSTPSEFPTISP